MKCAWPIWIRLFILLPRFIVSRYLVSRSASHLGLLADRHLFPVGYRHSQVWDYTNKHTLPLQTTFDNLCIVFLYRSTVYVILIVFFAASKHAYTTTSAVEWPCPATTTANFTLGGTGNHDLEIWSGVEPQGLVGSDAVYHQGDRWVWDSDLWLDWWRNWNSIDRRCSKIMTNICWSNCWSSS